MTIEWNRVTWYSKFLAIVIFVCTFAFAFYIGREYEKALKGPELATFTYESPKHSQTGSGNQQVATSTPTSSRHYLRNYKLYVGGSVTDDSYSVKLNHIKEDSRCPVDVQCIQAGRVVANLTVTSYVDGKFYRTATKDIVYDGKLFDSIQLFKVPPEYFIEIGDGQLHGCRFAITSLEPSQKFSSTSIDYREYELTVSVTRCFIYDL